MTGTRSRAAGAPAAWTPSEWDRRQRAEAGETVVANLHIDHRLIWWAQTTGRAVHVGREYPRYGLAESDWASPFLMRASAPASRGEACALYEEHLAMRPDLLDRIGELAGGKVLTDFCAPLRSHADVLAGLANRPA